MKLYEVDTRGNVFTHIQDLDWITDIILDYVGWDVIVMVEWEDDVEAHP